MQHNLRLGFVMAAVASLGLALSATVSASGPSGSTVHVIEHADTDTVVFVGASTDHTGNLLTFHNPIFNKADTKQVGDDRGDCIRIDPVKGTWECRWTTYLPAGQITVEGPFNDGSNTVLSITGGTGAYSGARGQMQLLSRNGGAEFDFIFELSRSQSNNQN